MEGGYCGLAAPPSPCSQVVLRSLTGYKRPVGDRRGRWSLSVTRNMRLVSPAHPGRFIRTEIMEPLGLSVTDAARALGVTRPALSALLNVRAALSPEMALRIEKAFGVKMDTLLRMQTSWEIALTRRSAGRIRVKSYIPRKIAA